jgi:hypothetical protein
MISFAEISSRKEQEVMKKKSPTCIDCRCEAVSHNIERHGRQLTMEEITFSCGARQKEVFTTNGNTGRVEFDGCTCAA